MGTIDSLLTEMWTKVCQAQHLTMLSGYHRGNLPFLVGSWVVFIIAAGATAMDVPLGYFLGISLASTPIVVILFAYGFTFTVEFQAQIRSTPTFGTMREIKPHLP